MCCSRQRKFDCDHFVCHAAWRKSQSRENMVPRLSISYVIHRRATQTRLSSFRLEEGRHSSCIPLRTQKMKGDVLFVADHPAVVRNSWDMKQITGRKLVDGSVLECDCAFAGQHEAYVFNR